MEPIIQEIELPGGGRVLARVTVPDDAELPDGTEDDGFGYRDVGAVDRLSARVEQLNEVIAGVGSAVRGAAAAAAPHEVTVAFGVELALRPGRTVALLADGESKAALSVSLTWRGDG